MDEAARRRRAAPRASISRASKTRARGGLAARPGAAVAGVRADAALLIPARLKLSIGRLVLIALARRHLRVVGAVVSHLPRVVDLVLVLRTREVFARAHRASNLDEIIETRIEALLPLAPECQHHQCDDHQLSHVLTADLGEHRIEI